MKGLICGLSDPTRQVKLSDGFIKRHFVLVEEPGQEVTISPVKQILIDILQTRCGVKKSELE